MNIEQMAREAGFDIHEPRPSERWERFIGFGEHGDIQNVTAPLERFAALVLEEAARECEPSNFDTPSDWTEVARIRAHCAGLVRALKG